MREREGCGRGRTKKTGEREGEETQRVSLLRRQAPIEPETPRESQHTRIPHLLNTIPACLPAVIRSSSLVGTTWKGCFEWCGQLKRQPVRNRSSLPEYRDTRALHPPLETFRPVSLRVTQEEAGLFKCQASNHIIFLTLNGIMNAAWLVCRP